MNIANIIKYKKVLKHYITIIGAAVVTIAAIVYAGYANKQKRTPSIDAINFAELNWTYGGSNSSGAKLDNVRIADLNIDTPYGMSITWVEGLHHRGYANTDPRAMACLFCKIDGKWRGGKFEWISTSRTHRDFKNIRDKYANWDPTYLNAKEFAFVIVSGDGSKRSNTLYFSRK